MRNDDVGPQGWSWFTESSWTSEREQHQLRKQLDLTSTRPARSKLSRDYTGIERRLGPWELALESDGTYSWKIGSAVGLEDRFKWNPRPLTSRKPPNTTRVLLIGESAAGSFGYWGQFSLAAAIKRKLDLNVPGRNFEVIDLSCVNALWRWQCLAALHSGMTLDPDLAIVFCGNNEARNLLQTLADRNVTDNQYAFAARWGLTDGDLREQIRLLNRCYETELGNLALETVHLAREFGVELIPVIPEYNLKDWRGCEDKPFHLDGALLTKWRQIVEEGESALKERTPKPAVRAFKQAIAIDGGACQYTHWSLAQAFLLAGCRAEAREELVFARDSGLAPFVEGAPQITGRGVEKLRAVYESLNQEYVDLPRVFEGAAEDGIPDRELFIDYCHLTARGHNLLAEEIARTFIEKTRLGKSFSSVRLDSQKTDAAVSGQEASLAALVAAIHNYQNGQPDDIVLHFLAQAYACWSGMERLLVFLADHVCSFWREKFTIDELRRELELDSLPTRYEVYFARYFFHARFDLGMKEMIEQVIGREPKLRRASLVTQTRKMLRDLGGRLQLRFFMDCRNGFRPLFSGVSRNGWERDALPLLVTDWESTVTFPLDAPVTARLVFALTAADCGVGRAYSVFVNGIRCQELALRQGWHEETIALGPGSLVEGINHITFRWPGMSTMADYETEHERQQYADDRGYYPYSACFHDLRLLF